MNHKIWAICLDGNREHKDMFQHFLAAFSGILGTPLIIIGYLCLGDNQAGFQNQSVLWLVNLRTNESMLMLSNQKLLAQCFSQQDLQHFYKVLLAVDFLSCKALHLLLSHQEYFLKLRHIKVRHFQFLRLICGKITCLAEWVIQPT